MKNPNKSAFGVILDSVQLLFSEGEIRIQCTSTGTGLEVHNVEVHLILNGL